MDKEDFRRLAKSLNPDWTDAKFEQEWRKFLNARRRHYRFGSVH